MSIRKVYTTLNVRKAESQTTIEGLHVGDVGSTQLVISLMDGTRAIDLTKCGNVTAIIHGKKPDGYEIHNQCDVEGGKILYTLTAQDTAVSGTVYYQLDVQIDDGSGEERCFSPCFRTQVSERVYEPVFRLLDSEPEDWAQNYAKYYKKVDDVYVKNNDPTYAADTFYVLVDPPVDSASEFLAFWSAFYKVEGLFNQRFIIDHTTTDVGYDPDNVHKVFINATIQSGMKGVVFTAQDNKQYALCDDGLLRTRTYSGSYSEWKITSTFARYVETSVETPLSPNDCKALNTIYRVNIDSDGLVPTGVMPLINSVSSSGKRTQYALTNSGFIISRSRQSGGDFGAWSLVPPVDKQLSVSSTNVVQNKVITAKFNEILNEISVIVDKAIIENTEMLSPDVTFNVENDDVADYLSKDDYDFTKNNVPHDNAYDGADYLSENDRRKSTFIEDTIDSAVNERPNGGEITIPAGGVNITLYDTANKTKWSESITGDTYTVKNLIPNRVYTYIIKNSSGEIIKSGSCKASGQVRFIDAGKATTYFTTDPSTTFKRPIFNIRDLGGWACDGGHLKYGLIYRGCRLNGNYTSGQTRYGISISPEQIDFFKNFLGIRDEIDFRQLKNDPDTGNTETAGDDAVYETIDDITDTALGIGVEYTIIPIKPYYSGINISSNNSVQNKRYAAVIKRIARDIKEGKPCYIHCLEGADRTATVAMLILALCGVSRNNIERDYELTSFSKDYAGNRNRRARNDSAQSYRWMTLIQYLLGSSFTGATFRDKIIDYVLKIGVTIEEINTIRAGLIDGAPEKIKNPNSDVSVTYNLTNINTDNPISSIAMYQPFEATLTALNMKEIQSVTVLMGNTDITSTAYIQEKISIPRVTGNISITASASDVDIYSKPNGGIPKTDLSSTVQTSLSRADSALQSIDNGAVTSEKLGSGAVTSEKLASNSVTLAKLHSGVIDSTLSAQGAAAEAKTTGEARNRFDSTVQGASSTNTSDSIYLKTGETAKITISDFDGTLISVFIKGHLSPSLPIYRDGVYKFTAQYDGLLRLYGAGTTTFIADVELMTLAAVRLENTQARADSNTLEIDTLKDTVFSSVNGDVEQGSYHTYGGYKYNTDIACRTSSCTPQTALRAVFNDGIKGSVRAYDINGTYVGGYTGSGFSTDATQFVKLDSPIALRDFTAEYGYNLKLVFTKSAGGNIVPNDVGLQYEFSVIPDEAEIYTVGTNGDFSGFTEMLIALASNSKEKIVYVDGGVYDIFDEMGGAEYISSIENASSLNWRDVNHIVPPNTTIIGVGKVVLEWNPSDSEIIGQNHAFLFSPLNLSGSCTIKNIEIRCSNCRYGIHDETSGKAVYNGTTRVLDNVRVYFTASTYGVHYAYGAGHNKNSKYIYNNCVFSAAYGVAWSSHDWTATEYENSTFEFNNCIFKNNLPTSPSDKAGLRFSSSATDSRQDIVKINGCDFNSITFGTEGSNSVKQGYTVTTMLCPSFTVTYTDRIASGDRIAPTVYLTLS